MGVEESAYRGCWISVIIVRLPEIRSRRCRASTITRAALDRAADVGGVFCAATHYWEFDVPSQHAGDPCVSDHLSDLISRALELPRHVVAIGGSGGRDRRSPDRLTR